MNVKVAKLDPKAQVPQYMSEGASGADVCACLEKPVTLKPFERSAIPTGLCVEVPKGFEIQVRPRSGLSFKEGLTVVNAPGTIDSDYRGEIKILLVNLSNRAVTIEDGMRVAQWVLCPALRMEWELVSKLNETKRGAGGFGSTGLGSEKNVGDLETGEGLNHSL